MAIKYDKNGRPYEEVEDPAALIDAGRAAGLRQAAQAPATGLREQGSGNAGASPVGAYSGAGATQQPISYENAGDYLSANQAAIDALRGRILGRGAFDYDYTTDPRWQAYRKEYVREGQRAAADTLGQAAALTGGRPSTAAITASQQAGNYYAAQLADKIPELYAAAYDMWQDADSRDRANLAMLLDADQTAYERGLDARKWQYQLDRDAVEDARYSDETDYNRAWNENERDYTRGVYADETAYSRGQQSWENNLALAKLAASYGDFSMLRRLGFDDDQIASITAGYQAQLAGSGGSGGGSGSSRRSGSSGEDTLRAAAEEATGSTASGIDDDAVLDVLLQYFPNREITDEETWAELTKYYTPAQIRASGFRNASRGVSEETAEELRSGAISRTGRIGETTDSGTGTPGNFDFGGDYEQAIGAMVSRGVPSVKAHEILSREDFTTRAQRRDPTLTVFSTYEDYLNYMAREYTRLYGG